MHRVSHACVYTYKSGSLFQKVGRMLKVETVLPVNVVNNVGRTALHYATSAEEVSLLYTQGANLNAQDVLGLTPLHLAVIQGNLPVVEQLIALGANSQLLDNGGWTIKARILLKLTERWIQFEVRKAYERMLTLCESVNHQKIAS